MGRTRCTTTRQPMYFTTDELAAPRPQITLGQAMDKMARKMTTLFGKRWRQKAQEGNHMAIGGLALSNIYAATKNRMVIIMAEVTRGITVDSVRRKLMLHDQLMDLGKVH